MNTDQFDGHTLNDSLKMGEPDHDDAREMLCRGGIVGWLIMSDHPTAETNARLIAAAPDLLDLLIDARRMVKELHALLERVGHEDDAYEWAVRNIGHIEMTWWNPEACVGDEE
jgi:hypothetical protein